jgi:hypothetical protein
MDTWEPLPIAIVLSAAAPVLRPIAIEFAPEAAAPVPSAMAFVFNALAD